MWSMVMAFRHVRRHWKKYVAGQCVGVFVTSYLIRRHRERNVIREYCSRAKRFGEEKVSMLEKPKRIMVFLNSTANNSNAKIHFTKYAAPLLHLSGLDVTVVESEYQGHIQMLMNYVDPRTDGVIIAGGDGTIMEVLNGIMRRPDAKEAKNMVLGILPLGKENRSFKTLFPSGDGASQARNIGEATMKVLHGLTKQVPVMEIHPEKGSPLFALSSIQWGVFKEAFQNRDRFWVFGKLRILASYLSTVVRSWPGENIPSQWHLQSSPQPSQSCNTTMLEASNTTVSTVEPEIEGGLSETEEGLAGFKVSLPTGEDTLLLTSWPLTLLQKSTFLKHGLWRTVRPSQCEDMVGEDRTGEEFALQAPPQSGTTQVSVDGEQYEPVCMHVRLRPRHFTLFT